MATKRIKIIVTIILLILLLFSMWAILKPEEDQEEESKLLINESPKVCYMPKDCFETEKKYLDQFPGKEEPKHFPECLIYCYE